MSVQHVSFKRYVEVGRVVLITKGDNKNKLATIVEIVDQNRAVVDGPTTGVARQVMPFREMTLTRFVVKLPRAAGTPVVKKAFEASDVAKKWAESKWAKTLAAREARKNTTDFDRFKVEVLKKQRRLIIGAAAKKVQA